jgi:hypothetical protein
METTHSALCDAKRFFDARPHPEPGLTCHVGVDRGCAVLKLRKPSWTNDDPALLPNQTGIFFSVWAPTHGADHADYNVHALKLRHLRGYRIASRDFATDFRRAFKSLQPSWPNVRVDYGPQTLMQGWIPLDPKSFPANLLTLLHQFDKLTPIIDDLLAQRRALRPARK